jgi:hypothetical protein
LARSSKLNDVALELDALEGLLALPWAGCTVSNPKRQNEIRLRSGELHAAAFLEFLATAAGTRVIASHTAIDGVESNQRHHNPQRGKWFACFDSASQRTPQPLDYIQYYLTERKHSALGYLTPQQLDRLHSP